MSKTAIAKRAEQADAVAGKMKAAASVTIIDSRGFTIEQDTALRRTLRENGVEFKIIKNSILTHTAGKTGLDEMKNLFVGSPVVAFSDKDVITPAKILSDFAKGTEALEIKGGAIEDTISSEEEVVAPASLPNHEGLLSIFLSVLQTPARNVTLVVKAVADDKRDDAT